MTLLSGMEKLSPTALFQHQLKHEIAFLKTKSPNVKSFKCFNVLALLCTCFICVCFNNKKKKKHTHTGRGCEWLHEAVGLHHRRPAG